MAKKRVSARTRHERAKRAGLLEMGGYHVQLERQGGGCAACGATPKLDGPRLHVDHRHADGTVRGLLCWRCNRTIGASRDDAEALFGLAVYLRYGWAAAVAYRAASASRSHDLAGRGLILRPRPRSWLSVHTYGLPWYPGRRPLLLPSKRRRHLIARGAAVALRDPPTGTGARLSAEDGVAGVVRARRCSHPNTLPSGSGSARRGHQPPPTVQVRLRDRLSLCGPAKVRYAEASKVLQMGRI